MCMWGDGGFYVKGNGRGRVMGGGGGGVDG